MSMMIYKPEKSELVEASDVWSQLAAVLTTTAGGCGCSGGVCLLVSNVRNFCSLNMN